MFCVNSKIRKESIMAESISAQQPLQPFTTIKYTTKDGEHITATKKDGIVTLNGDKNGVRQMPLEDFKKELLTNLPQLEKTPNKDTVELTNTKTPTEPEAKTAQTEVNNKAPKEETKNEDKKLDTVA